jgi:signal transduction histidine kinase
MLKFEVPKRLIESVILMSLILVLIIGIIISLINEKARIQSALDLSQQNREQLLTTESVTESLLLVDARFKEYCITFEQPVFQEYKTEVNRLVENIRLLHQIASKDSITEEASITKILEKRTKEADIYVRLKQVTDSLIFSVGVLEENQIEIEKYIGHRSDGRIDTLIYTETKETYKKGLLGKIKSAIVGEKVQQNVSTKILVQSPKEGTNLNQDLTQTVPPTSKSANSTNIRELVQQNQKLKGSELKLIKLNNSLIAEIRRLIDDIKSNIRIQEEAQNNSFLNSVRNSTDFLQNILIVLMILACILAGYIILLAYKNNKFQDHIISLNEKITSDSIQKDKFFSIIGHDLMNPFNALLGFSEMLSEATKKGDKEDSIEYSAIVYQSARRIFNLLQNLLVWSKMQNGKIKYSPKLVKVDELISDSMMIVTPIARNKEIKLSWNVSEDVTATLDSNMIGSVLQNLVTNAIKFTERGGLVTVNAFVESGAINFTVSDTGIGMSEERQNKLFKLDKTSSSKGTDDEVGTGLGLIICKEFVESHQGKIWVESTLGKGSKFCFSIPLS